MIISSFIYLLMLVHVILTICNKSCCSKMLMLLRMMLKRMVGRVRMRRDVLSDSIVLEVMEARGRLIVHVSVHLLVTTLAHHRGSVRCQLSQILLLGHLSPLLVVRLALRVQAVPHGGHHLGDLAEAHVGVATLDAGLSVSEEESVGGDWLLRLIRISLLLSSGWFGFLDRQSVLEYL